MRKLFLKNESGCPLALENEFRDVSKLKGLLCYDDEIWSGENETDTDCLFVLNAFKKFGYRWEVVCSYPAYKAFWCKDACGNKIYLEIEEV